MLQKDGEYDWFFDLVDSSIYFYLQEEKQLILSKIRCREENGYKQLNGVSFKVSRNRIFCVIFWEIKYNFWI